MFYKWAQFHSVYSIALFCFNFKKERSVSLLFSLTWTYIFRSPISLSHLFTCFIYMYSILGTRIEGDTKNVSYIDFRPNMPSSLAWLVAAVTHCLFSYTGQAICPADLQLEEGSCRLGVNSIMFMFAWSALILPPRVPPWTACVHFRDSSMSCA